MQTYSEMQYAISVFMANGGPKNPPDPEIYEFSGSFEEARKKAKELVMARRQEEAAMAEVGDDLPEVWAEITPAANHSDLIETIPSRIDKQAIRDKLSLS